MQDTVSSPVIVDWSLLESEEDFYETVFRQCGSPSWHGTNLNALADAWVVGGINDLGPPYSFHFTAMELTREDLVDFRDAVVRIAKKSVEENGGLYKVSEEKGGQCEASTPALPSTFAPTDTSVEKLMNASPSELTQSHNAEPPTDRKSIFHFWRCFWLSFLVVSLAYVWYCFYVPTNHIAWADNYASAQKQANDSGKPMILYFTGKWCVPCRIMKRQVWADAEVAKSVNAQFVPVSIDLDNPADAAALARYNVSGTPVTIITDPQGNALRWRAGGIGKSEFLELLKEPNPSTAKE